VGITADLFARVAMPNFHGLWTFHISTCERFDGFALYLCKKIFYQRTQNNDKTCTFQGKKKGSTNRAKKIRRYSHFTKRSAVTPTTQKDSPLSHKGVELQKGDKIQA